MRVLSAPRAPWPPWTGSAAAPQARSGHPALCRCHAPPPAASRRYHHPLARARRGPLPPVLARWAPSGWRFAHPATRSSPPDRPMAHHRSLISGRREQCSNPRHARSRWHASPETCSGRRQTACRPLRSCMTAAAKAPAECKATRADEHAVSTLTHGPCRPKRNDRRPAATAMLPPVVAKTLVLLARYD
eukprot:5226388-Prymnesium_polylepis.2